MSAPPRAPHAGDGLQVPGRGRPDQKRAQQGAAVRRLPHLIRPQPPCHSGAEQCAGLSCMCTHIAEEGVPGCARLALQVEARRFMDAAAGLLLRPRSAHPRAVAGAKPGHPQPLGAALAPGAPPPLPPGCDFHVFLTHDWGVSDELGRNNHETARAPAAPRGRCAICGESAAAKRRARGDRAGEARERRAKGEGFAHVV